MKSRKQKVNIFLMKTVELSVISLSDLDGKNSFTKELSDLGTLVPWYLQTPRPVYSDT